MLKITGIRIPVGEDEDSGLRTRFARLLKVKPAEITQVRILRKSLDVRDKRRLEHVYTAAVGVTEEERILRRASSDQIRPYVPDEFTLPPPGEAGLSERPVIVGAGPAGLFAALFLAEMGYAPLLLERGLAVRDRVKSVKAFDAGGPLDPESNYLFGEGGAGTFSDGKLTCRTTGSDTDRVLELFAECKGKPSVVYESRPHLGSNRLPAVVKALRGKILAAGGEIRFGCRADDLIIENGRLAGVVTNQGPLRAGVVVLAIGHSARDTYDMLLERQVAIEPKPFQMGVRIEHPQMNVNVAQFGTSPRAALLGAADYTMKVHADTRDLFTFCMCAGGYVMPSVSQEGFFCTNGMSRSAHESPLANSGLVVTVDPSQLPGAHRGDPLIGIRYQMEIESAAYRLTEGSYRAPIQWARDFIKQQPSQGELRSTYPRGVQPMSLWEFLPPDIAETLRSGLPLMDDRWGGLFLREAVLLGPEARGSCPVRLPRDRQTYESTSHPGLYPIGEGAGYAGGIVSAAVDGLKCAKAIRQQYRPLVG